MLDAKEAVRVASQYTTDLLNVGGLLVEEAELVEHNSKPCWAITLSFVKRELANLIASPLSPKARDYKTILVDAETGQFISMKIRELSAL